jgi:hypothetical protein
MTIPAAQPERWLKQARDAAAHIKGNIDGPDLVGKDPLRFTFAFDKADGGVEVAKVELPRSVCELLNDDQLAGALFTLVLSVMEQKKAIEIPAHGLQCLVGEGEAKCGKPASGGLRISMYGAPTVQKRYGRKSLLSLVMDLPTCCDCFPIITAFNVMSNEQWAEFSKICQQRNNGIVPARDQTVIELIAFDDKDYVALRHAQQQPAPAAPQPEELENGA